MKNDKASGPMRFSIKLLKNGTELFFELLAYTFSFFLRDQKLLPLIRDQKSYMLLTAYTSNLHKKGDRKVCSNYRGVSVMNSIS